MYVRRIPRGPTLRAVQPDYVSIEKKPGGLRRANFTRSHTYQNGRHGEGWPFVTVTRVVWGGDNGDGNRSKAEFQSSASELVPVLDTRPSIGSRIGRRNRAGSGRYGEQSLSGLHNNGSRLSHGTVMPRCVSSARSCNRADRQDLVRKQSGRSHRAPDEYRYCSMGSGFDPRGANAPS